jgi:hypothetical protein
MLLITGINKALRPGADHLDGVGAKPSGSFHADQVPSPFTYVTAVHIRWNLMGVSNTAMKLIAIERWSICHQGRHELSQLCGS